MPMAPLLESGRTCASTRLFDQWSPSNKSLDASGGSVFRNLIREAMLALIRAAASTQPFGALAGKLTRLKWPLLLIENQLALMRVGCISSLSQNEA